MDYISYRTILGVGFNDEDKQKIFMARMQVFLQANGKIPFTEKQERDFCYNVGMTCLLENRPLIDLGLDFNNTDPVGLQRLWIYLSKRNKFEDFLATVITFINNYSGTKGNRNIVFRAVKKALKDSHIPFELYKDKDGVFVIPKGAEELDKNLVFKPLKWLESYPNTRKLYVKSLKEYASAKTDNASKIADDFRKTLECFFKEFFNEDKSLENMVSVYGNYLKDKGIPKEISNDFEKLLKLYTDFNNHHAKHNNDTQINTLEYIMYQTGNIIRLLCTLAQEK